MPSTEETPPGPAPGGDPAPRSPLSRAAEGLAALGLVAGGLLGARAIVLTSPRAPEAPAAPPRPVPVSTVRLERTELVPRIQGTGTLEPVREAGLALEGGGEVVWVREDLRPGAWVEAGEPLVRLDPRPLELEQAALATAVRAAQVAARAAAAEEARAEEALGLAGERLELAVREEERWLALAERGISDEARLDAARAARVAARSAATEAQRALEAARAGRDARAEEIRLAEERVEQVRDRIVRLELRAPFGGRFVARPGAAAGASGPAPAVGEVLAPFAPVGGLLDTTRFRARVAVHADDLPGLEVGSPARVQPSARPELALDGAVTAIGARVDARTRAVDVEVLVDVPAETGGLLPAGSFADVE
ncbi:MAG: HlyD family efflux transporter periplasmic adaptor subunit, partial [Planctomycetota bacterium]